MPLHYKVENSVYLLAKIREARTQGSFLSELVRYIRNEVNRYNRLGEKKIAAISRSTFFNYLKAIDRLTFEDGVASDALRLADAICENHPALARKIHRKLNPVSFNAARDFLLDNAIIDSDDVLQRTSAIEDPLFFSLTAFLRAEPADLRLATEILPGDYTVYRPSLSASPRVIVSCAQIVLAPSGALIYREVMHFRGFHGWRRQIFNGYVKLKSGAIFIITHDSNTQLVQFATVFPTYVSKSAKTGDRVEIMAGRYSGVSNNRPSRSFSTGILLKRADFRRLRRFPIERWRVGQIAGFGLVDRAELPRQILDHMFE